MLQSRGWARMKYAPNHEPEQKVLGNATVTWLNIHLNIQKFSLFVYDAAYIVLFSHLPSTNCSVWLPPVPLSGYLHSCECLYGYSLSPALPFSCCPFSTPVSHALFHTCTVTHSHIYPLTQSLSYKYAHTLIHTHAHTHTLLPAWIQCQMFHGLVVDLNPMKGTRSWL